MSNSGTAAIENSSAVCCVHLCLYLKVHTSPLALELRGIAVKLNLPACGWDKLGITLSSKRGAGPPLPWVVCGGRKEKLYYFKIETNMG